MNYYYISFATGAGFRGATVVKAMSPHGALAEATRRRINPGGEAVILELPAGDRSDRDVAAMLNRLVGRREMESLGAMLVTDCPPEMQSAFNAEVETVGEDRNPVRRH